MLVASAAMFFAVAGSAFILRARMATECCPRAHTSPEAPSVVLQLPLVEDGDDTDSPATTCGKAVYRNDPDGTVSVTFQPCSDAQSPTTGQTTTTIPVTLLLIEE